ncbi:MAG TPA: hypothetical protein VNU68_34795 [Verrucomicrobiae bacterium]|nr:hypothetical protein [Verrucomicrobiae bacterium]
MNTLELTLDQARLLNAAVSDRLAKLGRCQKPNDAAIVRGYIDTHARSLKEIRYLVKQ